MSDGIYRPVSEQLLARSWGRLTRYEFDLKRRDGSWTPPETPGVGDA